MKETAIFITLAAAIVGAGWLLTANQLQLSKYFSPRFEQVRRETFEQSKAYRQGAIQELQNMQFQYEQAAPAHRAALATIILRRAADIEDLPMNLRGFVDQLRTQR